VLDQAGELCFGHIRLARLDGVQDRSCFEGILGFPGVDALLGLPGRLAVEWCFECGGEIVPEGDVCRLIGGVLGIASQLGCVCECDDRVAYSPA